MRAMLNRVERLEAAIQKRRGGIDPDELVRILREGRARAARGEIHAVTAAQALERGRALRRSLREAGRNL